MYAHYIPILLLFLILFLMRREEQNMITRMIARRKTKEEMNVKELAIRFEGKRCIINTFNNQFVGVITKVTDGALLLETKKGEELVNLDYVVRIQEYPEKKQTRTATEK